MKTKLHVEPDVELDMDNEDHQRILLEQAYKEEERARPKPALNPKVSPAWWFWRLFGWLAYVPVRFTLVKYLKHRWQPYRVVNGRYQEGYKVYSWPGAQKLDRWIQSGARRGRGALWVRRLLNWFIDPNHYSTCLHCGFTDFREDQIVYDRHGEEGRTVDLFEMVEGGGTDYWGEANDCRGWQWCYRCGNLTWETH